MRIFAEVDAAIDEIIANPQGRDAYELGRIAGLKQCRNLIQQNVEAHINMTNQIEKDED